ncbi:MAG: nucleotidyltransferase [Verrucomicrobia bacterium]|nr:nucleotidyltransferase [Verrucomicrobiota bacterium]
MEQLTQILERLNRERVEFVLVGGLAGVFHGVPLVTRDVDVCLPFTEQNLFRLERALDGLNPVHRQTPQRLAFKVADDFPRGLKNLYLRTDLGVLDCLGEISGVGDYLAVRGRSEPAELPVGTVHILSLSALIDAKAALDRTQDKLALIHLRRIQQARS